MAYSNFTLEDIEKSFGLDIKFVPNLFSEVEPRGLSQVTQEVLKLNVPLAQAIHTEKARSELIVAPLLVELKRHFAEQISLFSGVDLNIDFERGLNGVCDFFNFAIRTTTAGRSADHRFGRSQKRQYQNRFAAVHRRDVRLETF